METNNNFEIKTSQKYLLECKNLLHSLSFSVGATAVLVFKNVQFL
jgi:hypothetical protein